MSKRIKLITNVRNVHGSYSDIVEFGLPFLLLHYSSTHTFIAHLLSLLYIRNSSISSVYGTLDLLHNPKGKNTVKLDLKILRAILCANFVCSVLLKT